MGKSPLRDGWVMAPSGAGSVGAAVDTWRPGAGVGVRGSLSRHRYGVRFRTDG